MKILAFDLGKFNSVVCVYDADSGTHRFSGLATHAPAFHDLLTTHQPDLVVFETCSTAGWLHDLCHQLELQVLVANPSHEAWRWKNLKRKTDRDDALKLAKLAAMKQLPTVYVPSSQARQHRALIKYRSKLIGRRTAAQNHIRSLLTQQGILAPLGQKAWTQQGLKVLSEHAKPFEQCNAFEIWRGQLDLELKHYQEIHSMIRTAEKQLDQIAKSSQAIQLVQTIPGIGPRAAETIVAYLDDPHRFKSRSEVGAYAGLTPKQYQSGQMNRHGRINRRGPRELRRILVEVGWVMTRYNPWARQLVAKLTANQRIRKKQAIVALARKTLIRAWAMLRTNTPWEESHKPKLS